MRHRPETRRRFVLSVLLTAAVFWALPRPAHTQDAGIDWQAVRTTAPENWSVELKDQLTAAGYDLRQLARRVRNAQAQQAEQRRLDAQIDWQAVRTTAPEDWSAELKDQLAAAGYDLRQLARRVRQYQQGRIEATAGSAGEATAVRQETWGRIKAGLPSR